jgi:hypothetical protein
MMSSGLPVGRRLGYLGAGAVVPELEPRSCDPRAQEERENRDGGPEGAEQANHRSIV